MRYDALILCLVAGLQACVAPAPCGDGDDCASGACENGACVGAQLPQDGAVDQALDMPTQADAQIDQRVADAAPQDARTGPIDAARLDAFDAARPDAAIDAAPDMPDAAQPCTAPIELSITRPRAEAPMVRGAAYVFEVQADPPRADIEVTAPYGALLQDGDRVEWAPRGGNPGDLPWPWWTGPVELTVVAQQGACRAEETFRVNVAGDVLVFDEVSGAIWVVGSNGRLFGEWRQLPGNGVTAMAHVGDRELLAAVRQPNEFGHHLIHRLDPEGQISATLAADDFESGDALLRGAAKSIQVLPNGLITATSTVEASLPFWSADGRLSHRLALDGPISSLGRLGARAIFTVGDTPAIIGSDGVAPVVEIGRNAIVPRALFELHDPGQFLAVAGAGWDILVRYSMGEFVNLRPPPAGSDVRAVTRFLDGYLVYDFRNRRLRNYDAGFQHAVMPDFAPDVRQITVAGLLWLDQRRRVGK